jgi:hypothetical protein
MPTYRVTDPQSGKTIKLTGDSPPTEAELSEIFATVGGQPAKFTGQNLKDAQGNAVVRDTLASTLPGVGGFVGGLAGTPFGAPGRIAGAAIGGMAGKGYQELVSHAPELWPAIKDVYGNLMAGGPAAAATVEGWNKGGSDAMIPLAVEGGKQAALQAGGEVIAAGASAAAPWLMKSAQKASALLREEFPTLTQTAIDNAVRVSDGGLAKARVLLRIAADKVDALLGVADKTGMTIPIGLTPEIAESFKTALLQGGAGEVPKTTAGGVVRVASERLTAQQQIILNTMEAALEKGTPMALKPSEASFLKTELQRESKRLYEMAVAPGGPKAVSQTAFELKDFAARLNDAIDAVTPGYRAGNKVVQPLIGLEEAIFKGRKPTIDPHALVAPIIGAAAGGAAGQQQGHPFLGALGGAAGTIGAAALTSPAGLSSTALLLAHPVLQQILTQMPRTTATALTAFLESQSGRK